MVLSGNTAAISVIAALHGIDSQASIDWARGQIDYMLGNNPLGISYQIKEAALGWSPRKPRHRASLVATGFVLLTQHTLTSVAYMMCVFCLAVLSHVTPSAFLFSNGLLQ